MANIALHTDPLDELRLIAPSVPDRLPAMLFLAALFHGILIIGVTFNPELANQFADAISLEVTIVADADQQIDRPDEAAYLAQASQQGGGNTTDQVRPTAPLQSSMPVDNDGLEDGTTLRDTQAHQQSADEVLATEDSSDRQVEVDPRPDPQPETSTAIAMEAGSEVTLPLPQEESATMLIRDNEATEYIISADTIESPAAAYINDWKNRVEAVGAEYLPQLGGLDDFSGSPTLLVEIGAKGELIDADILVSSGSTILDLASLDILQRSSPFNAFNAEMIPDFESGIKFRYKWLFDSGLLPTTSE